MNFRQLFQNVKNAVRSRFRWVVLALGTVLCCILVFPKVSHPAVTWGSQFTGLSIEQWRSQSPISLNTDETPESKLQEAHRLQLEGFYRRSAKLLLEVLDVNLSDSEFEKLIRNEYSSIDVEKEVQSLFPIEQEMPFQATALRSLGDVLRTMGSLEPSRIILEQSLAIADNAEEQSEIHFSLGNTYRSLGKRSQIIEEGENKQIEKKENDKYALEQYDLAIAQSSNESLKLRAKLSKLSLLVEIQPDREVISLAKEIESTVANSEPKLETVYARIDLAQSLTCLNVKNNRSGFAYPQPPIVNLCQSDPTERISSIDDADLLKWNDIAQLLVTAERQAKELDDGRSQSYALGNLGEVYEIQEQFGRAKSVTQEAAKIAAQSNQRRDILYRWEWQIGRLKLKTLEDKQEAIDAYRGAFDSLRATRRDLTSLNSDIQFNFRDEIEPVYRQFVEVLLQPNEPSQENLKLAREVIEALQLAEIEDFLKAACAEAKPRVIDELIDNSPIPTAVLYPILLENKVAVILKLSGQSELRYESTNKAEIFGNPNDFLSEFLDEIKRERLTDRGKELSREIYNWTIEPFDADLQLAQIQNLVFVLDGQFRNIPLAALSDGKNYLIQNYSITLAPGLQILASTERRKQRLKVLGVGYAEEQTIGDKTYEQIKNAITELEQLKISFSAKVLLDEDFTPKNLEEQLTSRPFSLVHIATHGKFSSNSDQTYIVASKNLIKVNELGNLLRTSNLNNSRNLDLLVLSACETATGDNRATLGIAGISVKAGVRTTLATLWRSKDDTAPKLFQKFYQQLIQTPNLSKAEALRQAQLSLMTEDPSIPPYELFPYILLGNGW